MHQSQYPVGADLTGEKFGRLTVLSLSGKGQPRRKYYNCRCDCGVEVVVSRSHLLDGSKLSCGCLRRELAKEKIVSAISNSGNISGTKAVNLTGTKPFANSTSGYRGVSWDRRRQKYTAQITFRRRKYHLGVFDDPKEAHKAYLTAKQKIHTGFLDEIGWSHKKE